MAEPFTYTISVGQWKRVTFPIVRHGPNGDYEHVAFREMRSLHEHAPEAHEHELTELPGPGVITFDDGCSFEYREARWT